MLLHHHKLIRSFLKHPHFTQQLLHILQNLVNQFIHHLDLIQSVLIELNFIRLLPSIKDLLKRVYGLFL